MKEYSEKDIGDVYNQLIADAGKNVKRGKYETALLELECAAEWMYQFNLIYCDDNADNLIKKIADNIQPFRNIINPVPERCAMVDSWGWDNCGLTQQYLRALMHNNIYILYICTGSEKDLKAHDIIQELSEYKKSEIYFIAGKDKNRQSNARKISDLIVKFSPSRLFLHITPFDTTALLALCSVGNVLKYNINLTDHAFWLGSTLVDYNIEFRAYGETVSLEKRGFNYEQLLPLPYYPIKSIGHFFKGLPSVPSNAIKVFTGGALYKMLGKNDVFFKILEQILSIEENVYIFVAGFSDDKRFTNKIQNINGKERIYVIGRRDDIDALFDHIDIYLSTYPMIGGLMSQYAAMHEKPIIAYHDEGDSMNVVEDIINNFQQHFKSYSEIDEMKKYAERLIKDEQYRREEGKILAKGLMTEELFAKSFYELIVNQKRQWNWSKVKIDYQKFFERYLDLEISNGYIATRTLLVKLKINTLLLRGKILINILAVFFQILKKKVLERKI